MAKRIEIRPYRWIPLEKRLLSKRKVSHAGCWLWQGGKRQTGYGFLQFTRGESRKQLSVHRVAAHVWMGMPLDSTAVVCHHCDVPACFNPEHLYLGTHATNKRDAIERGQAPVGERHYKAKLTVNDVLTIRTAYRCGASISALAREFKCSPGNIDFIVKGKSWKSLLKEASNG